MWYRQYRSLRQNRYRMMQSSLALKKSRAGFLTGTFFKAENSPLSGEFQKGEAYTYPQKALLCLERSCPDFS